MNRAKLYLCCVALLLVPAIAGAATADYVYGMPLDVARVLSVDEAPSDTCQVVRATLVYLDSHGERQVRRAPGVALPEAGACVQRRMKRRRKGRTVRVVVSFHEIFTADMDTGTS
ncbi:DUF2790 domain-containing protein [Pseudomonas aeruginosa]|uniref:DUF2790 domain-containing protein n=1 Tax=Pseudomonas aeruginosa TaxID=287 RepID=UPI003D9C6976